MNKTPFVKLSATLAALSLAVLVGCGDDSSSPAAPPTPGLSSASDLPLSSAVVDAPLSSAEVFEQSSSSVALLPESSAAVDVPVDTTGSLVPPTLNGKFSFNTDPVAAGLVIAPDEDGFYAMGDVYKAVPATSKIAFVIRHSKREKSLGTESQLTPIGVQMATTLGEKLAGEESFYYASTDFVRTRKTCEYIAAGRGETAEVVTWSEINGGYFLTVPSDSLDALVSNKGGNPKYIAMYSYGKEFPSALNSTLSGYFYDLYERGNQFVSEVIVANMLSWKRVSVLVSHDALVEPLIAFVTDRTINLKVYEKPFRWVNYLSGIAVVVDAAGAVTVLPVKGDSVGWMIPSQEIEG